MSRIARLPYPATNSLWGLLWLFFLLCYTSGNTQAAPGDILFEEQFTNNGDFTSDWTTAGFGSAAVSNAVFNSGPRSLQMTGVLGFSATSRSGRIDTSGIVGADVTVWIRRTTASFFFIDNLSFQYLNDANIWTTIDTYSGTGASGEVFTPSFSLPADGLHANLRFRFAIPLGFFGVWHIDDVVVTETGGVACGNYLDEFGSNTYTNSNGTLSWTSNPWVESNDNNNPSNGLISISSGELELSGNGSFFSNTAITRQADTSGATALTLSFDFQMLGGVDLADSALVEISGDGGGSWTTLETFVGFSNNDSGSRSYDISAYAASNMQVRFAISPDSGGACCFDSGGERMEIDNVLIDTCATSSVDHFSVQHSGTGITCESENVTFVAHDAADAPVNVGGNSIDITPTSSTPGWSIGDVDWTLFTDVNSGNGTFTSPSPGVARYTFATNETYVQFAYSNTSEADIDFDVVDVGDPTLTDVDGGVEDPVLSFTSAGLRFYNDADGDGNNDGTPIASPLTSGTASAQLIVRAVQTNTDTGLCEARVSGAQTVNMGYECVNPTSCVDSDDADINGTAIGENDLGNSANLNGVNLTFDADGEAPFNLEYYDAGIIRLIGSLPLPANGTDPAITIAGTSDTTIVRPADLVVTAVRDSIGNPNPGTTTGSPGFITSGSPFTVVVQARNADGGITPNYGAEIVSEGITLVANSLLMPAGGTLTALTSPSTFTATATAGEFQNTALRWDQAGTLTVRAEGDGDYLGTGNIVGITPSGNIGRFYPDHFDLTAGTVDNGCLAGGFTYMSDQAFLYRPLDVAYSVVARSVLSTPLSNYDDGFSYPTRGFNTVAEDSNNGTSLASRSSVLGGIWSNGIYTVGGGDTGGFARALSGLDEVVDGPYSDIQLGITPNGSGPDSIAFLAADLTMHPSQANDCVADGDCNAAAIGTPFSAVFGRLYGRDAHGPETAALAVTLQTEFWNGTEFVLNATDSCTVISAADILFDGNDLTVNGNRIVTVGGGTSTGNFSMYNVGTSFEMQNGSAGLVFTPPGATNLGSFNVNIDLTNYSWLRNDWDSDDDFANDLTLPTLEIDFGRYRGHDRIIFWQEVLN